MVNTKLNLSMTEPYVRQIYAKEGDTGRVLEIGLDDYPTENGTLRILRPDGVEKTSDASSTVSPTITDGMATFDSLEEAEVTELKIALSPKQDLHGQSSPYPSGGGANCVEPSDTNLPYSSRGVTISRSGDNYTVVASSVTGYPFVGVGIVHGLKSGDYYLSAKGLVTGLNVRIADRISSPAVVIKEGNGTFNIATDIATDLALEITSNGNQIADGTYTVSEIQIVKGTTAPISWSPYSNICPIYPSNGKNLIDADTVWSAYRQDDGTFVNPLGTTHYSIPQSLVGKELTFSAKAKANSSSANCRVSASIGGSTKNGNLVNTTDSFTLTALTITPTSTSDYVVLQSSGDNGTYKEIQLELGTTATPYVPYQGINLYQAGENVASPLEVGTASESKAQGSTYASMKTTQYKRLRSIDLIPTNGQQFTVSADFSTYGVCLFFFDSNALYLGQSSGFMSWIYTDTTITRTDVHYVALAVKRQDDANMTDADKTNCKLQFMLSTTYPLSLGQSVYGGTLDVVSGKLTVEWGRTTVSNCSWTYQSEYSRFGTTTITGIKLTTGARLTTMYCSQYQCIDDGRAIGDVPAYAIYAGGVNTDVFIKDARYTSAQDFKTNEGDTEIVYPLQTPIEVDLTPTQISTLLGENNVWSDGEITELTFDYGKLLSVLTADQTAVVGRCIGDVNFNGASTMPFTLVVKPNNKEIT